MSVIIREPFLQSDIFPGNPLYLQGVPKKNASYGEGNHLAKKRFFGGTPGTIKEVYIWVGPQLFSQLKQTKKSSQIVKFLVVNLLILCLNSFFFEPLVWTCE